jgi:hypothetical protein
VRAAFLCYFSVVVQQFPSHWLAIFLAPCLCSFAAEAISPEHASLIQRQEFAQTQVAKRLGIWQERLQLQEWKITLVVSHKEDLRPGTLGNIHWDLENKTAKLRVLDPAEYEVPFQKALDDMEFTVVHELIHLEFASMPRTDASRADEEHAVNRMADALLQLERQERPVPERESATR